MSEKKQPNPIDIYVGSRIRLRRKVLNISQEKLGERLGITFQQVQKYEKGTNRVGASRLQAIAEIMNVPVSYFFEEAPVGQSIDGFAESDSANYLDFCSSNEGIQLLKAFTSIRDPKVRRKLIDLAKALSDDATALDFHS